MLLLAIAHRRARLTRRVLPASGSCSWRATTWTSRLRDSTDATSIFTGTHSISATSRRCSPAPPRRGSSCSPCDALAVVVVFVMRDWHCGRSPRWSCRSRGARSARQRRVLLVVFGAQQCGAACCGRVVRRTGDAGVPAAGALRAGHARSRRGGAAAWPHSESEQQPRAPRRRGRAARVRRILRRRHVRDAGHRRRTRREPRRSPRGR